MKKFFGSYPVAVVLTVLIVAFSGFWMLGNEAAAPLPDTSIIQAPAEQTQPNTNNANASAGTNSTSGADVQSGVWVCDTADVLSDAVETNIKAWNESFDKQYASVVAVVTVNYTGSDDDLERYAEKTFDRWGLGGNDLLYVMNTKNQWGYLYYGENRSDIDVGYYLENYSDPYTVKENYESAVEELLDALGSEYFPFAGGSSTSYGNGDYYQSEYDEQDDTFSMIIGGIIMLVFLFLAIRKVGFLPFMLLNWLGGSSHTGNHYHSGSYSGHNNYNSHSSFGGGGRGSSSSHSSFGGGGRGSSSSHSSFGGGGRGSGSSHSSFGGGGRGSSSRGGGFGGGGRGSSFGGGGRGGRR